jgi:two-component system, OmpR family, sensor histidine kinase KdpD
LSVLDKRTVSWRSWVAGLSGLAAATLSLYAVRASLDKAHVVIVLLLVVLLGSAAGGRLLGLVLAVGGFLVFDFWFLPPYNTFVVADPLDWLVLLAFLATGVVAAQLLARAQREAARANRRALEVDRLAALGSETLSVARADEALLAITRVMTSTLGVAQCHLFPVPSPQGQIADAIPAGAQSDDLAIWVAAHGRTAWTLMDGTARTEAPEGAPSNVPALARALYVPLRVRERTVGVLYLADEAGVSLDPTRQRYLDALAHYAALGLERLRLTGEAEHAEALREADRLKDALMATVSHDLRTPLTTIRGLAHDIAREGDERAYVIEDEVIRLNALVTDLLDMSRLNAGGIPLNLAYNTADELMGAALQMVGGAAAEREIRASIDPAEPLLVGRFDLAHSVRILGNLLDNAIKYSPIDQPVDFTVKRDGLMLVFDVSDRGRGVPESERERIFAPFHRGPTERPDVGGTGLGLAIAKGLAEAQQGTVTCTAREGGGTVFTLRLPAADLTSDLLLSQQSL